MRKSLKMKGPSQLLLEPQVLLKHQYLDRCFNDSKHEFSFSRNKMSPKRRESNPPHQGRSNEDVYAPRSEPKS